MPSRILYISFHSSVEKTNEIESTIISNLKSYPEITLDTPNKNRSITYTPGTLNEQIIYLTTKYYSTEIIWSNIIIDSFCINTNIIEVLRSIEPDVEAIVLLIDIQEKGVQYIITELKTFFSKGGRFDDTSVRILAVTDLQKKTLSDDSIERHRSLLQTLAFEYNFELLYPLKCNLSKTTSHSLLEYIDEDDDSISRIIDALVCTSWKSIVRPCNNTIETTELSTNLKTKITQDPCCQLEEIFSKIHSIREKTKNCEWSDAERREAACRAMSQMIEVLDLQDDDDDDDDST